MKTVLATAIVIAIHDGYDPACAKAGSNYHPLAAASPDGIVLAGSR